jgi:hypothetical protein
MATLEYEVYGASAFRHVERFLREHGYANGSGSAPGQYSYAMDAAPGWSDWYYWLAVFESPDSPVRAELDALLKTR